MALLFYRVPFPGRRGVPVKFAGIEYLDILKSYVQQTCRQAEQFVYSS
jgi:hypothetical protein